MHFCHLREICYHIISAFEYSIYISFSKDNAVFLCCFDSPNNDPSVEIIGIKNIISCCVTISTDIYDFFSAIYFIFGFFSYFFLTDSINKSSTLGGKWYLGLMR